MDGKWERRLGYLKDLLFSNDATFDGNNGERKIQALLEELPEGYYVLNDIIIDKKNEGTSQIDHVVVSKYGIFVIETKNYSGSIYGKPQNPKWTHYVGNKKYTIYNPMMQNFGHIRALQNHLHIEGKGKFIPLEVFFSWATVKVEAKGVIQARDLVEHILSYKQEVLTREEVIAIYYKLKDIERVGWNVKKEHVDYVNKKKRY